MPRRDGGRRPQEAPLHSARPAVTGPGLPHRRASQVAPMDTPCCVPTFTQSGFVTSGLAVWVSAVCACGHLRLGLVLSRALSPVPGTTRGML